MIDIQEIERGGRAGGGRGVENQQEQIFEEKVKNKRSNDGRRTDGGRRCEEEMKE